MKLKDLNSKVKIRLLDMFFTTIIASVLMIARPLYLVHNFGVSLASLLLIGSIIIGVLFGLYSGYISDIIGRRKIMIGAQALLLIALALLLISNSPWFFSPWLTFIGFILITISGSLNEPASEAMLLDISTDEDRKYMYTYMSVINNLSFGIGAILAGFLYKDHFFTLSIIMTVASVLALMIILFFIKETYVPKESKGATRFTTEIKNMYAGYKTVFKNKVFLLYFSGSILAVTFEMQIFNHIGVRLTETIKSLNLFKWEFEGAQFISILSVENTLIIILFGSLAAYLMNKFKERRLLIVGITMTTIGYVLLATTDFALIFILGILISTLGELLYVPIKHSYLGEIAEENARSSYLAVDSFSFNIGSMLSSVLILVGSILGMYMFVVYIFMGLFILGVSLRLNTVLNRREK